MKFLFVIHGIGFFLAMICFFWSLKYRRDSGDTGPYMGMRLSRLREFYVGKGGMISLIGSISFMLSGIAFILYYLTK